RSRHPENVVVVALCHPLAHPKTASSPRECEPLGSQCGARLWLIIGTLALMGSRTLSRARLRHADFFLSSSTSVNSASTTSSFLAPPEPSPPGAASAC